MNIYSQRITRSIPHSLPRPPAPATHSVHSQTNLSCPPFKSVSLQTRSQLRHGSSQTELPQQFPAVGVATQTDMPAEVGGDMGGARGNDIAQGSSSPARTAALVLSTGNPLLHHSPLQSSPAIGGVATKSPTHRGVALSGGTLTMLQPSLLVKPDERARQSGSGEVGEEERQKKDLLLARLRALDGQREPPASQPISTAAADTPTNNVTTTTTKPPQGRATPTGPTQPSTLKSEGVREGGGGGEHESEAERKKRLLLAQLMAIDDSGDTELQSHTHTTKKMTAAARKSANAQTNSRTSLTSWPETVENMHQGRPALASEGDPFGSRHSLLSKTGADSSAGRQGRRRVRRERSGDEREESLLPLPPQQRQPGHKLEGEVRERTGHSLAESGGDGAADRRIAVGGANEPTYLPLHGRRAQTITKATTGGAMASCGGGLEMELETASKSDDHSNPHSSLTGKDYPWEHRVNVAQGTQASPTGGRNGIIADVRGPGAGPRPLLPLRPKMEHLRANDVMAGVVAEPDDLEELAL